MELKLGGWKVDHRIITLYLELALRKECAYVCVNTLTVEKLLVARYAIHYGETPSNCNHARMEFYNNNGNIGFRYRIIKGNEQIDERYFNDMSKDELAQQIANMLLFLEGKEEK